MAMPATGTESGWTGVVLAGGQSRRMGRDKATLVWRGKTLLEHMCIRLQEAGATRIVVSGAVPEKGGVPDRVPGLGPLGGIASVAAVLDDGPLLVVPVDMPLIEPEWLARLAACQARCACYQGHMLPLWLQLDALSRRVLSDVLQHPPKDRSLKTLHAGQQGVFLPLPEQAATCLVNLNTPEQWQEVAS
jgi:molybdopterin-guanine dinucleotide biosynthesis protein A